ncbi:hypothetical protein HYE68_006171 [Fusarium pseudograminearum]|nr:hypothetical protein HYE68_006171 [Fusarium pseudograminearum]
MMRGALRPLDIPRPLDTPLQHCELHINASAEVTIALLAGHDRSQLISLHCYAERLLPPEEQHLELEHSATHQYRQIMRMRNLERLYIYFSQHEQDSGIAIHTTFREIREITSSFPRLEWLIIHENAGSRNGPSGQWTDTLTIMPHVNMICNHLKNDTNLTHLAFAIPSHRAEEIIRHDLLRAPSAESEITRWYLRLARMLVEASTQLQHVAIMDKWPYYYSARKGDDGVTTTEKKDERNVGPSSSFPRGLQS